MINNNTNICSNDPCLKKSMIFSFTYFSLICIVLEIIWTLSASRSSPLQHLFLMSLQMANPGITKQGIPANMKIMPYIHSGYGRSANVGKSGCGFKWKLGKVEKEICHMFMKPKWRQDNVIYASLYTIMSQTKKWRITEYWPQLRPTPGRWDFW